MPSPPASKHKSETATKLRWGAACLNCRKYKIRCDGKRPVCGRCTLASRADCAYGKGPPPTLDARLQEQFPDYGQHFTVITPPPEHFVASQSSAPGTSSLLQPTLVFNNPPRASPPEFLGPNEIYGLSTWNQKDELPVNTRRHMLEILIPQRLQFAIDFHYTTWRRAIILPASDPNSFHPSLVYAIALAAVSLCGAKLQPYEHILRAKVEAHLEHSITFADRVEDSIWARVIMAWHSIRLGKCMAALHMSTANVSLALGGNMHLMPDPDDFSQVQHGLLPPTLSRQHAIERSNLWWSIFLLDSILAFALNVPPQIYHDLLDSNAITTRLPMPFDITPGWTLSYTSQKSSDILITGCRWLQNDTTFCLHIKAAILIHITAATVSAVTSPRCGPQDLNRLVHLERAAAEFIPAMPPLEDMRGLDGGETFARYTVNPIQLRNANCLALVGLLLAAVRNPSDPTRRRRRIEVAMSGADLARRLGDVSLIYAHVTVAIPWYAMAEALMDELIRSGGSNDPDIGDVRAILSSLRIFVDKLARLQELYPGLKPYLEYVEREFLMSPNGVFFPSRRIDTRSPFTLDA